jgi:6,7-dimethyl-8-ribityllumazine synthase
MRDKQRPIPLPTSVNPSWRIGLVCSSYYKEEIEALIAGARMVLTNAGISASNIHVHWVSGSFEIPLIGAALAEARVVDALMGFGIIVEGETGHARLIAENAARGIMDVQLRYRIPFAFEVLYVQNLDQAKSRVTGEQSKGVEAAIAVLHSLAEVERLRS